jgi:hypothetical protein
MAPVPHPVQSKDMTSDLIRHVRERSLGSALIALVAVIAIVGLAFFIYLH